MSIIRFTVENGHTYEVDADWNRLIPNLQTRGIRVFRPIPGVLIPVDKIILIEDITPPAEEVIIEPKVTEDAEIVEDQTEQADTSEPELSIEERKEQILKEMAEKSACVHENHDIYVQEIMSGPRNNRKAQKRYFPVCSFCGVRERYVKADTLTDEEKANAKIWDK
jgi:hypothetical protein